MRDLKRVHEVFLAGGVSLYVAVVAELVEERTPEQAVRQRALQRPSHLLGQAIGPAGPPTVGDRQRLGDPDCDCRGQRQRLSRDGEPDAKEGSLGGIKPGFRVGAEIEPGPEALLEHLALGQVRTAVLVVAA